MVIGVPATTYCGPPPGLIWYDSTGRSGITVRLRLRSVLPIALVASKVTGLVPTWSPVGVQVTTPVLGLMLRPAGPDTTENVIADGLPVANTCKPLAWLATTDVWPL